MKRLIEWLGGAGIIMAQVIMYTAMLIISGIIALGFFTWVACLLIGCELYGA